MAKKNQLIANTYFVIFAILAAYTIFVIFPGLKTSKMYSTKQFSALKNLSEPISLHDKNLSMSIKIKNDHVGPYDNLTKEQQELVDTMTSLVNI